MKTIQQVLKELDAKEIEKSFFYEYPIKMSEIKGHDDTTIGLYREGVSSQFQSFLERLRNMEIVCDATDPHVLFVCKSTSDDGVFGLGHTVNLIRLNELMQEGDLSRVKTYAYEFTGQKEALGFLVADTKLTQDNIMDVVVGFLYKVSFFGYEQEDLQKAKDELEESIKEIKEHPERLQTYDPDEIREELGIPKRQPEETYPEEVEKSDDFYQAGGSTHDTAG